MIESADTAKQTRIRVAVHYRSAADSAQRADDPQAIADAVRYLSESRFITCQCLTLDGGGQILPQ